LFRITLAAKKVSEKNSFLLEEKLKSESLQKKTREVETARSFQN